MHVPDKLIPTELYTLKIIWRNQRKNLNVDIKKLSTNGTIFIISFQSSKARKSP